MTEREFLDILSDIHNYGFFSGLRKDDETLQLWEDENPLISFLLFSHEDIEHIFEKIFNSAYNDGLKNICSTNISTWVDSNQPEYNKIRSFFVCC